MKYNSDSFFMRIALDYAWSFQTLTLPNPCVGSLVLCDNAIIALQAHKKAGSPHAEVLACKEAFLYKITHDEVAKRAVLESCKKQGLNKDNILSYLINTLQNMQDSKHIHEFITAYHSGIFHNCEFFVTLEPCNHYGKTPPCAELLKTIAPKRIIIAHEDSTPKASGGANTLAHIPITHGILRDEAHKLLFPFLQWQKKRSFTLFKIAHRLHGDYKNGIISNDDSRIFTHNMRCIADYIIISGATLRDDNPLLDTRFSLPFYQQDSINPKILILSKTMQEKDLKNYNIAHRNVSIIRSAREIPSSGFKIIEGGFAFLNSLLQDIETENAMPIDCIMGYIAPAFNLDEDIVHKAMIESNRNENKIQYTLAHTTTLTDFWLQKMSEIQTSKIIESNEMTANIIYYLFIK